MPKSPYKLISPQTGRHSEVCEIASGKQSYEKSASNNGQIIKIDHFP